MTNVDPRELTPNARQVHRFLSWLKPYADPWNSPYPGERDLDYKPPRHPSFTFMARQEMPGAKPPEVRLEGTLRERFEGFSDLNRTGCGIFVEVDAESHVVAELAVAPWQARRDWTLPPSFTIHSAGSEDCVWMLTEMLPKKNRDAVAEKLAGYGAAVTAQGPVLLRVPGFHAWAGGRPQLVTAVGAPGSPELSARYEPRQLLESLQIVRPVEAA